jgi:glycosyltransferase involved in cell wall biosynthesis
MRPVLNVFQLADAPSEERPVGLKGGTQLRAYWFSQTVGLDRGLQEFIGAMGRARTRISIDIQGVVSDGIRAVLQKCAVNAGVSDRVTFLGPAPPREMVSIAWNYDVGLALEKADTLNRDICLTNKMFTYLLAGTPVLLSSTTAHRELAPALGGASKVTDISHPDEIAAAIDEWGGDADLLNAARSAAWRLGRDRYNWETEKSKFLSLVESALASGKEGDTPSGNICAAAQSDAPRNCGDPIIRP